MSDLDRNPEPSGLFFETEPWSAQAQELIHLVRTEKLPNGLLFTGAPGTGKSKAALFVAMASNCAAGPGAPCQICQPCKKLIAGMHPDYICLDLEENKKNITISQIRDMGRLIAARPNEARQRVVFIRNAGLLNVQAQNALLKVLEEPPAHTFFILGADDDAPLLPTILSRCRQIRFRQPDPDQVVRMLETEYRLDSQTARIAVQTLGMDASRVFTGKPPGQTSAWPRRRQWLVRQVVTLLSGKGRIVHALGLSRQLAQAAEQLTQDLAVIRTVLRDLAVIRHAPKKIVNLDFLDAFHDIKEMHRESTVLKWNENFHETERRLAANSGPRLTLDRFFLSLSSAQGTLPATGATQNPTSGTLNL